MRDTSEDEVPLNQVFNAFLIMFSKDAQQNETI